MRLLSCVLGAVVVLTGCQHQAQTQPLPATPSAAVAAAETAGRVEQQVQAQQKSLEGLEQRLTLVQEQMINSNQNLIQLQQRAQQQLQAMQQLQMLMAAAPKAETSEGNGTLDQLVLLVERLEQMNAANADNAADRALTGPHYRLVSAYTAQGQWVILKYDEVTGLSWLAADGRWKEIEEQDLMPASQYQVVVRAASGDVKGYVAARIDHHSGDTWWLNGNRWEPFQ